MRDQVFRDPKRQLVDFAFDDAVADVFPDMIRRSVPGYELVVPMTGLLAARHLAHSPHPSGAPGAPGARAPRARAYDLGCSLGATTAAILRQLNEADVEIIAVDNAQPMIDRARTLVEDSRVEFLCADIRELKLLPCRLVVLNYVLQFVPPLDRLTLLTRVRSSLGNGGLALISEKIRFEDPEIEADYAAAHLDFKRANGYSELEISQKRSALEKVMILDSEAVHNERFRAAGFRTWNKWYQCLNWASFLVRT